MACGFLVSSVGCGNSGDTQDPAALEGVEWHLAESSVSSSDLAATGITASFEGGQMSGFSGVNQYSGGFTAKSDGSFSAGPLASTMMAGPEPLMTAEAAYLKLLEDADTFAIEDGTLTLGSTGGATLVFEQAEAVELPGSSWVVTGYNNGKEAVVSPVVDSELTIEFGTDGTVAGSGGVNRFNGPFQSTADTVKIGPLAATKMAGEPELMEQEAQYLAALEAGVSWKIINGVLEMRDLAGATQVHAMSAEAP
jgi:heat shock protein HslJ